MRNSSEDVKRLLLEAQNKLEGLYDFKLKGIFERSSDRWIKEGEISTHYFLNIKK